jgi:O-antigen/teichoic acid export membrane protein
MSRIAAASRNFVALGVGNYGAMAVGLAISVLLTRRLGSERYGYLALMMMVSQVALQLTVQWSHTGFVRFASREFETRRTVSEALWARCGIVVPAVLVAAVLLIAARGPLASYLRFPETAIWIVVVHLVATGALSVVGAIFQAAGQMPRYGVALLFDKVAALALLVVVPSAWLENPVTVLAAYALSSTAVAIWGAVMVRTAVTSALPTLGDYRHMAMFSVPVLLSSWAGLFGANWFDLVILKWYVPMSGVGVYSLSTQLAGVTQQIAVIFSTLVLPPLSVMVAEGQEARLRAFVERLLPYWLLGTSIVFTIVLFVARVGVPFAFGESFRDAAPVVALLMVATGAATLFHACAPLVAAYGAMWVVSAACIISAVVNVALDLMFIPRFGLVGSALATVLAYSASALVVLGFVQKRLGGHVFRLTWLGAPVVVACICFMVFESSWFYLVTPVAAAVTVSVLIGAFRLFHRDDAIFLKNLRLPMPFGIGSAAPVP